MKLFYRTFGESDKHPLILLHGLFGMGDNWTTLARNFSTDYFVIVPDLRNHGQSPHSPEINHYLMSDDLFELMNDLGLDRIHLLGHSMGGKVAMEFALQHPDRLSHLMVADIAPRAYAVSPMHEKILDLLNLSIRNKITSRKAIETMLSTAGFENAVIQLLMKNLFWAGEELHWRFNIDALRQHLSDIAAAIANGRKFDSPTLFLRGANSNYIGSEDESEIRALFPASELSTIPNAGHWLHAEQPELFAQAVRNFLQ